MAPETSRGDDAFGDEAPAFDVPFVGRAAHTVPARLRSHEVSGFIEQLMMFSAERYSIEHLRSFLEVTEARSARPSVSVRLPETAKVWSIILARSEAERVKFTKNESKRLPVALIAFGLKEKADVDPREFVQRGFLSERIIGIIEALAFGEKSETDQEKSDILLSSSSNNKPAGTRYDMPMNDKEGANWRPGVDETPQEPSQELAAYFRSLPDLPLDEPLPTEQLIGELDERIAENAAIIAALEE